MDLNNVSIKDGTITLRELKGTDAQNIATIVRKYSRKSTESLYNECLKKPENIEVMRTIGLDKLAGIFETHMKRTTSQDVSNWVNNLVDECLFSPYGPLYAPFQAAAEDYITCAIKWRADEPRENFRLGVETKIKGQRKLIGCLVFNTKMDANGALGDVGLFFDPSYPEFVTDSLVLAVTFLNWLLDNKYPDVLISATTHRFNQESLRMLARFGFDEQNPQIITDYGERQVFVGGFDAILQRISGLSSVNNPPAKNIAIIIQQISR
jgi:hypothetical protein